MRTARLAPSLLALLLLLGCDPSGGEVYDPPDLTWGPGSNALYNTNPSVVERICDHVFHQCHAIFETYEECLHSWDYEQELCPEESDAYLTCMYGHYYCGAEQSDEWWDLVETACEAEDWALEECLWQHWDY
jgi:hypothetical protein